MVIRSEQVGGVAGPQDHAIVARTERLRRLAVDRHQGCGMAVEPHRDHARLGGIDEPQAQPLVGAHSEVGRREAVGYDPNKSRPRRPRPECGGARGSRREGASQIRVGVPATG
jgi:hypothetical protein